MTGKSVFFIVAYNDHWDPGGGGGGGPQTSSDRDDRIGTQIKTQKSPWNKI